MTALPLPLSARERRQPHLRLAVPERSRSSPDGDLSPFDKLRASPSNFSNTEEAVNEPPAPSVVEGSRDAAPLRCLDCQGWDSSMSENSPWGFCILRGQYLKRDSATGCDRFLSAVEGSVTSGSQSPHSSLSSLSPPTPPPLKRRRRGDGSGYIQLHYHTSKKGKSYEQYYYHYELWENGVRQIKSCAYIPKKKLPLIQSLESEKAPVTRILQELGKLV